MATDSIVLGGGCFWCLEAAYQRVAGVRSVISGYAGGSTVSPSYEEIETGRTGHAQVVKVEFDPVIISLEDILDIFWAIHDPTTPDRQGNDIGPQYRSIILYASPAQRTVAEMSIAQAQSLWDDPIVTQVGPLTVFYPAEGYHQDYYNQNQHRNPYCSVVINPKLITLRKKFAKRLLPDA